MGRLNPPIGWVWPMQAPDRMLPSRGLWLASLIAAADLPEPIRPHYCAPITDRVGCSVARIPRTDRGCMQRTIELLDGRKLYGNICGVHGTPLVFTVTV